MTLKNHRFESEIKKNTQVSAKLIWAEDVQALNEYCLFRKTFECERMPKSAVLTIFVQSKYKLYVNGESVARGNAGISEKGEMDEVDVLPYLKAGKNVIGIFACYHAYPLTDIALRQKGVIFNLKLDYSGARKEEIVSDRSVKAMPCDAYLKDAPCITKEKCASEVMDNTLYPSDWTQAEYDDSAWDNAKEKDLYNTMYFDIEKSAYKPVYDNLYSAKAIIAAGSGNDVKGLNLKETFYSETQKCELNKLYVMGVECEIQPIDKGQYSYILVDFDKVCTGYIKIDVSGYGGDVIDVIFAKELDDGKPVINGAARFMLKAENNILETHFDRNEFKYVLMVFRNPVRTNVINGIWAVESKYPFENASEFSCNDEKFSALYEKSASRVKASFENRILCANDENSRNTIFDQRIFAVSGCYLTGELIHFKNLLCDFASMITKGGMPVNNRTFNHNFDFYDMLGMANALKDYCCLSADESTLYHLTEKVISVFKWISGYEKDGMLQPVMVRDSLKSEYLLNLYYAYSLDSLCYLCGCTGDKQALKFYEAKALKLKKALKQIFESEKEAVLEENRRHIYDICGLLILTADIDITEKLPADEKGKIYMPLEFVRAMKKANRLNVSYSALNCGLLDFNIVPVLTVENVLGIDFMNKKSIKSSPDTEKFAEITAKIYSPKGVVDIVVKDKNVEKNLLYVNINQADGEF